MSGFGSGAGFFVYFNTNLNINRLVFSEDLSDAGGGLGILAALTDLAGQDPIDALATFSSDNFLFINQQPDDAESYVSGTSVEMPVENEIDLVLAEAGMGDYGLA